MNNENIYPIKVVANKTGLTAYVIRAWEKRYSAIEPYRTDTNRRLYCEKDIQRLSLLKRLTKEGHNISSVAKLKTEELEKMVTQNGGSIIAAEPAKDGMINYYLSSGLTAIEDLDEKRLQNILSRASIDLSQPSLMHEVLIPMIKQIGDNWKNGSLRIYHEHLASAVIKTFLSNLRDAFEVPVNAPQIIIATPVGQMHELGALLVAAAAASEGWRVTYLGSNLPAEEITAAVNQRNPKALALSLVYPPDDPEVHKELIKISKHISNNTTLYVGGNATGSYLKTLNNTNANVIFEIKDFRKELVEIRKK